MIPSLEDMSWIGRIGVAIAALVIAFLLILLFDTAEGQLLGRQHPALTQSEYDERFAQLDREAIERAYVEHIMKLFSIWTTDYSPHPPKAVKGAANARSAYTRAMAEVDQREKELLEQKQKP